MGINLEFKARVRNRDELRKVFCDAGAKFVEDLKQTDTYFCAAKGRLKLRESDGKQPQLIYYERDETSTDQMESSYRILQISDLGLKEILSKSLGVKIVVRKMRTFMRFRNARIHLDQVSALGEFLEFEVVSKNDRCADARTLSELKTLAAPFVLQSLQSSYSDLMLSEMPSSIG